MTYEIKGDWTYCLDGYGGVTNCDLCYDYEPVYEFTRQEDGRVMFYCSSCREHLKI